MSTSGTPAVIGSVRPGGGASARTGPAWEGATAPFRTCIATVCLSGTIEDKLTAAAEAGFDGVEIFEPDLVVSPWSPAQIRSHCTDLGLTIDLYQPLRDFDSADPAQLAANVRRAGRKFDVMEQLGTDLVLVCSSVAPDALDDDDRIADQLRSLATVAGRRGLRICYEALAWGRHVNTYERSWEIVRRADHPALGLCVDSFHILSRGSDPAGIADIPGDKLFFLQLADAPYLSMDVLQWSRHHRLFPGQGAFDLPAFMRAVVSAGYRGPWSLEVFNDVFRQAQPRRAAVDARRSLLTLREETLATSGAPAAAGGSRPAPAVTASTDPPPVPVLDGYAFVELAVDDAGRAAVAATLRALGFQLTGTHLSKPVQLWQQGAARILLNSTSNDAPPATSTAHPGAAIAGMPGGTPGHGDGSTAGAAALSALAVETADPAGAAQRAAALLAPVLPRTREPAEAELSAIAAPDGTSVFFCRTPQGRHGWLSDFAAPGDAPGADHARPDPAGGSSIGSIDHVALTQPFDRFDEAALFYRAVLGLRSQHSSEVAAPFGLVRNRAVADAGRTVRLCLSVAVLRRGSDWRPGVTDPQHVAFSTSDAIALARSARSVGAHLVRVPANYYDDLDARLALPPALLAALRESDVLYDRTPDGEFLHFYTAVLGGRIFFEVVQRIAGYDGYGETNSPVRMAAHRVQRISADRRP